MKIKFRKKIQKHQVGEGSVNLRMGGAVTEPRWRLQEVGQGLKSCSVEGRLACWPALINPTLVLSGYHLSLANCLAATYCYNDLPSECTALDGKVRMLNCCCCTLMSTYSAKCL